MSIFDNALCRPTGTQRIDSLRRPLIEIRTDETGRMADTIDRSTEYLLTLRLAQNFWANRAQRDAAHKAALRALAAHLYEDVLREIPHLILAIESGDREEALVAALRIQSATQP